MILLVQTIFMSTLQHDRTLHSNSSQWKVYVYHRIIFPFSSLICIGSGELRAEIEFLSIGLDRLD